MKTHLKQVIIAYLASHRARIEETLIYRPACSAIGAEFRPRSEHAAGARTISRPCERRSSRFGSYETARAWALGSPLFARGAVLVHMCTLAVQQVALSLCSQKEVMGRAFVM